MSTRAQLTERDLVILEFLWKWKLATTSSITLTCFPQATSKAAHLRLLKLESAGYIQCHNHGARKFIWTLSKKGFLNVKHILPQIRSNTFRPNSVCHDLLVTAVHLGECLAETPDNLVLVSEQQLRCVSEHLFPKWLPKSKIHRPDGYWQVQNGNAGKVVALEVELSVKEKSRYGKVADFYATFDTIDRILWVAPTQSECLRIQSYLASALSRGIDKHCFVCFKDFKKNGWNSKIIIGRDISQTINELLNVRVRLARDPNLGSPFLDLRKSPHNSGTYRTFEIGDFSNWVANRPTRQETTL